MTCAEPNPPSQLSDFMAIEFLMFCSRQKYVPLHSVVQTAPCLVLVCKFKQLQYIVDSVLSRYELWGYRYTSNHEVSQ